MVKFLKQKNKRLAMRNSNGFTLVETLIALSVFSIAIVGIMTVLSSGISDINLAKKKMTATFLAQEGIEYIRNMRDNAVLFTNPSSDGWNNFTAEMVNCSTEVNGCIVDRTGQILSVISCSNSETTCQPLLFKNGEYGYNYGETSPYIRTIFVKSMPPGELEVTSTVSWGESNSITLSESLFNWYGQ